MYYEYSVAAGKAARRARAALGDVWSHGVRFCRCKGISSWPSSRNNDNDNNDNKTNTKIKTHHKHIKQTQHTEKQYHGPQNQFLPACRLPQAETGALPYRSAPLPFSVRNFVSLPSRKP